MKHSVFALECLVDPLGALGVSLVLDVDLFCAQFPSLHTCGNVQSGSYVSATVVINNWGSKSARRQHIGLSIDSVEEGHILLVGGGLCA